MICYICDAPAITVGTFTPDDAFRILLGVPPKSFMVFGLCKTCYRPGFSEHVEARIFRDLPAQGRTS